MKVWNFTLFQNLIGYRIYILIKFNIILEADPWFTKRMGGTPATKMGRQLINLPFFFLKLPENEKYKFVDPGAPTLQSPMIFLIISILQ